MRDFIEGLKATDDVFGYVLEHRSESVKIAVLAVGIMTVLLLFLYRGGDEVDIRDTAIPIETEEVDASAPESLPDDGVTVGDGEVCVDIGGAVKNPLVARLPYGSRIEDAILQAGGLDAEADIRQINRAEILVDGQKIYIPKKGEVISEPGISSATADGAAGISGGTSAAAAGKVNINMADLSELQTLTGVGPVTAQKIIDYRTQSGRFSRIEDLKNVSGIGEKTYEKMKDQVTV